MKEFLSEQAIRDRVCEMAAEISKDYRDHAPIFVGILNGSFIFMADLLRELTVDSEVAQHVDNTIVVLRINKKMCY